MSHNIPRCFVMFHSGRHHPSVSPSVSPLLTHFSFQVHYNWIAVVEIVSFWHLSGCNCLSALSAFNYILFKGITLSTSWRNIQFQRVATDNLNFDVFVYIVTRSIFHFYEVSVLNFTQVKYNDIKWLTVLTQCHLGGPIIHLLFF